MTKFLKIVVTILFFGFWGQFQRGCTDAARASGSGLAFGLYNIFGLITLIAGTYGIWKYKPNKTDESNDKLDKR